MRNIDLFAEDVGHADDIVQHMNLRPSSGSDGFDELLQELHRRFRRWSE